MIPNFSTIRRSGSGIDHQDGRHLRRLGRVYVQGRQGGSVLDGGDGSCESWRSIFLSMSLKAKFSPGSASKWVLTTVLRFVFGPLPCSHSFGVHLRIRRCDDTLAPSSGDDASRIARRPLPSYQHGTRISQRGIEGQASGRVECARRAGWLGGRRQREGQGSFTDRMSWGDGHESLVTMRGWEDW